MVSGARELLDLDTDLEAIFDEVGDCKIVSYCQTLALAKHVDVEVRATKTIAILY